MIYAALGELRNLMMWSILKKSASGRRNQGGVSHQLFRCSLLRNKNMAAFLASFDLEEFFKFQDPPLTA